MTEQPAIWYVRCGDCLTVAAVRGAEPPPGLECGACAGPIETMGRVKPTSPWWRGGLVRDETRTACDERCTTATGPNCSCACGGPNHGTGRVVAIEVGAGAIPRLQTPGPVEALARATAWREARARFRAAWTRRYGMVTRAKQAGEWVADYSRYRAGQDWLAALADIRRLRTHAGRLRALDGAVARMNEERP